MGKKAKSSAVVPRVRFPEFLKRPAWSVARMDELYSFQRNNTLSREKLNYENGTAKNIHYGDIHTKFSTLFDASKETAPYINATEELPDPGSSNYCVEGDIILADASEDTVDVGKAIEIVRLHGELILAGQHTILARRQRDDIVIGFGGHLFQSRWVRTRIEKISQGTKIYQISAVRLAAIEIAYPSAKTEQQKIADCLTSHDEMIAAQGRKVAALKTYKRGLMQHLFPREGETVPLLRFPEFRDSEPWEIAMGSTLFGNRTERGTRALPIYSVTMTDGLVSRSSLGRRVDDLADATANKKARKDDIVYNTMRMWQGACGVADRDCMLSPAYVVLAPQHGVHSEFFGYFFKLPHMMRVFTAHSRGLTEDRLRLYFDDFSDVPLLAPSHREQKRIAGCLTTLDARVWIETARARLLSDHKRALTQQLFPTSGKA